MRITRKIAALLLAVAGWNVVTYATFIRNLARTEGRPTGFYVAHTVLIVVNLAIAAVLGRIGWQALKAEKAERAGAGEAGRGQDRDEVSTGR
ncbi:SCO4848 family membrane protein [Actinopolymorpha singaporensis]|uniref:SCO4848 family membrane protein n=1 Tax=Actinopolymorpha singaporensis TaxID=117157 RepID=UPI001F51B8B4|nr:hypothetical protein [Actinopolymorpha singaporensis]